MTGNGYEQKLGAVFKMICSPAVGWPNFLVDSHGKLIVKVDWNTETKCINTWAGLQSGIAKTRHIQNARQTDRQGLNSQKVHQSPQDHWHQCLNYLKAHLWYSLCASLQNRYAKQNVDSVHVCFSYSWREIEIASRQCDIGVPLYTSTYEDCPTCIWREHTLPIALWD